ncbi:hypothetical protein ACF09I_08950 [Streptomyces sp. NPDC014940]|uniref:hypothetical protein n=1 Tax=Streptomyces sp. NPDC014940 TaxID=3364932 RepID=UPI0036F54F7D
MPRTLPAGTAGRTGSRAARAAAPVVTGRRIRRSAVGTHSSPVTRDVPLQATAPVSVVAHG